MRKGIEVKVPYGRYISCLVVSAVAGTLLPQVAYAAPASSSNDDGKGIVDTVKGWFSDDDEEADKPPVGGKLEIPSREKLPKGKKLPKAKRVKELTERRTSQARFWRAVGRPGGGRAGGRVRSRTSPGSPGSRSTPRCAPPRTRASTSPTRRTPARAGSVPMPGKLLRFEARGRRGSVSDGPEGCGGKSLKPQAKGDTVTYKDAVSRRGSAVQGRPGAGEGEHRPGRTPGRPGVVHLHAEHRGPDAEGAQGRLGRLSVRRPGTPVMVIPAPYMTDAKKDAAVADRWYVLHQGQPEAHPRRQELEADRHAGRQVAGGEGASVPGGDRPDDHHRADRRPPRRTRWSCRTSRR